MLVFLCSSIVARITNLWRWLERYPAPDKTSWTRRSWVALGVVTLAVILFCGYFILYLTQEHQAYQTNAEDLGIMDQALWNTVHGQFLHQTICNTVSDTNCVSEAGIMRFAVHFEPILLPISLLYLVFPDPRTLLVFQTIVVALGAYPAFLLAQRRLQHTLLAVPLALLYLLYPAQLQATVYDFHAVTLTSTLLLFTIYFIYTRRTLWMFVCAFLAMTCKEEISLIIVMLGLWSIILQHRWRSGLVLVMGGLLWFFLAVNIVMPYFSPTGHPLLIGRFGALGNGPLQIAFSIVRHPLVFLRQYVFESKHSAYLRILFIPALFLPLLAPWVMIIALPSILLNLISSSSQMYTGLYQYNAEIVPILLFATVEAIVVFNRIVRYLVGLCDRLGGGERYDFLIAKKGRTTTRIRRVGAGTATARVARGQAPRLHIFSRRTSRCDVGVGLAPAHGFTLSRSLRSLAITTASWLATLSRFFMKWAATRARPYDGQMRRAATRARPYDDQVRRAATRARRSEGQYGTKSVQGDGRLAGSAQGTTPTAGPPTGRHRSRRGRANLCALRHRFAHRLQRRPWWMAYPHRPFASIEQYCHSGGRKGMSLLIWRVEVVWLMALLSLILASSLHYDIRFHGSLPFSTDFIWPDVSPHAVLAQQFVCMIPPMVSVSAQSQLVPHISERRAIYLFPYASDSAEYIFLDTTGDIYPYYGLTAYERAVEAVLSSGHYGILVWDDGFLLLKRGWPPPTRRVLDPIFAPHRRSR